MKNKTQLVHEIGEEALRTPDLQEVDWESFAVVIDLADGVYAQSGFLYLEDDIEPFIAESEDPLAMRHLAKELAETLKNETGQDIVQILVQIQNEDSKIKIDFEYEDRNRWSIKPSTMFKMREELRPSFD